MVIEMVVIYKLENVWKIYGKGRGRVEALKGINLEVKSGEFISIMGPSGSGKTTLLSIMGLLTKPSAGKVYILGKDATKLKDREATLLRRKTIGFVFQTFNLVPWLTALENIELALAIGNYKGDKRRKAMKLLDTVGLRERAHHKPLQLSGGEQQRVAIARALANDPSIILADEPTGNLDSISGLQVVEMLASLTEEGRTVVMVTHDEFMAKKADRIVRIRDGKIEGEVILNEV